LKEPVFVALGPWARQLVFVEDSELHRSSSAAGTCLWQSGVVEKPETRQNVEPARAECGYSASS
jgi:hypothetical protein